MQYAVFVVKCSSAAGWPTYVVLLSWSSMWSSLTDQLVRKFKDSVGINITMKKFFIFVPVPIKKKLFERSEFLFRTRTAVQASCEKHSTEWSLPAATAARTAATCT